MKSELNSTTPLDVTYITPVTDWPKYWNANGRSATRTDWSSLVIDSWVPSG